MTPKEKAKELISKFTFFKHPEDKRDLVNNTKQCALICVDEIIEETTAFVKAYWIEVKEEINKL